MLGPCAAQFFDLARLNKAPIAIERDINGLSPGERRQVHQERSGPRVEALDAWLRDQHARLSPNNQVVKAIAYSLNALGRVGPRTRTDLLRRFRPLLRPPLPRRHTAMTVDS